MSPTTKTIRAHVYSATNPTALPSKLKMTPTTLPTMAGNTSTDFPASLLSASANLSNYFFKTLLYFGGETPFPQPLPKSPMIESTVVAIPAKKVVESPKRIVIISYDKNFFWQRYVLIKNYFKGVFNPCNLCLKIFSIL